MMDQSSDLHNDIKCPFAKELLWIIEISSPWSKYEVETLLSDELLFSILSSAFILLYIVIIVSKTNENQRAH
jgi:hypothetical protein